MKKDTNTNTNPIQVADKIFLVIETLAAQGAMGIMDLSNTLELNKTTVHRILNSLMYMGYVCQDSSNLKYFLTFKLCDLSSKILSQVDLIETVRPYLQELASQVHEVIHLVKLEGNHAVYIDKIESLSNSIRLVSQTGKSLPLYCSGVGKALLADMSDEKIKYFWENNPTPPVTKYTLSTYDDLFTDIQKIRERGYALDNEENEIDVRCIAVSFYDYGNTSKYAFSISAPVNRMDDARIESLVPIVFETKSKIMQRFGYHK